MRYAQIRQMDITNGEGIGVALFVQGCHFHCKGCFNPETWDFNGGKEWNSDIEDKFFQLIDKPYITRISILGGEPLTSENVDEVYHIIQKCKKIYPNKKIWIYSGYKFIDIPEYIKQYADTIIDGQFDINHQDLFNKQTHWAGSTNQKIWHKNISGYWYHECIEE